MNLAARLMGKADSGEIVAQRPVRPASARAGWRSRCCARDAGIPFELAQSLALRARLGSVDSA